MIDDLALSGTPASVQREPAQRSSLQRIDEFRPSQWPTRVRTSPNRRAFGIRSLGLQIFLRSSANPQQ
jgi:hypothetical protein